MIKALGGEESLKKMDLYRGKRGDWDAKEYKNRH